MGCTVPGVGVQSSAAELVRVGWENARDLGIVAKGNEKARGAMVAVLQTAAEAAGVPRTCAPLFGLLEVHHRARPKCKQPGMRSPLVVCVMFCKGDRKFLSPSLRLPLS